MKLNKSLIWGLLLANLHLSQTCAQTQTNAQIILDTPNNSLTMGSNTSGYGYKLSGFGDLNGDGYFDLAVGAPSYTDNNSDGAVFIYYGSITGLSDTPYVITNNLIGSGFGRAITIGQDLNGDSINDLVVGARDYTNNEPKEGALFIYYGNPSGVQPLPSLIIESNIDYAFLGKNFSSKGDVDNDGYSDLLVTLANITSDNVWVFKGSSSGLTGIPQQKITTNLPAGKVEFVGDLNNDNFDDIAITYGLGTHLFSGGSNGVDINSKQNISFSWSKSLGGGVDGAGDFNNDGIDDLVISDPLVQGTRTYQAGVFFVYYGSNQGIDVDNYDQLFGVNEGERLGSEVKGIGDFNGDEIDDILIATDTTELSYIFLGGQSGLSNDNRIVISPTLTEYSPTTQHTALGDINSDGLNDVAISSLDGAVNIYYGFLTNTPPEISGAPIVSVSELDEYIFSPIYSDSENDQLNFSITNIPSWANFSIEDGILSGTPSYDDAGEYENIIIEVHDSFGNSSSLSPFSITVVNLNRAPVFNSTPLNNIQPEQEYIYKVLIEDMDGEDIINTTVPQKPNWLTFNKLTNELSGTPTVNDTGEFIISIMATDGSVEVNQTYKLTVVGGSDTSSGGGNYKLVFLLVLALWLRVVKRGKLPFIV